MFVIVMFVLRSFKKRRSYGTGDFPHGKVLSKMSNKQTKYQTFARLRDKYNCRTNEQLYLCKLLNPQKCKLLLNQFL